MHYIESTQWLELSETTLFIYYTWSFSNSPRWLYSVGKPEKARMILARFHSSKNDVNSPLVDLEMREIEEKIEIDGADSKSDLCMQVLLEQIWHLDLRDVVGL